jgi:glycosyltransferase involved in cell wall biosynthesis
MKQFHLLSADTPDLSIVIPCLNEEDTLSTCLKKLQMVAEQKNFCMEVIVADNGSQDDSVDIALGFSAKVIHVSRKGYGSALMGGIDAAKAPFVLMADADDSYDFLEIPKFFIKLQEGYDLVQGCRLPRGGGKILAGAMPWSHRYIGNPLFTFLVRSWFRSPVNDVYCGMRAFRKSFYESLKMRCTGMEFATEMIIKSSNSRAKTVEIPITLHKDGRIQHPPHLRTLRDGWKTLCFFLICAPSKLFLTPGLLMILLGMVLGCMGFWGSSIGAVTLGGHTMLGSSLLIIGGYQSILVHELCLTLSSKLGINNQKELIGRLIIQKGLKISLLFLVFGLTLWAKVLFDWQSFGFGELDYASTMKIVIPGATLTALSFETFIFTLFQSWIKIEINSK